MIFYHPSHSTRICTMRCIDLIRQYHGAGEGGLVVFFVIDNANFGRVVQIIRNLGQVPSIHITADKWQAIYTRIVRTRTAKVHVRRLAA